MPDQPNVLVLLSDQHGYRYLGYRDDEHAEPVRTPALDDLAERGAFFESAYCASPRSTPSRVGLLTGLTVPESRAWDDDSQLRSDCTTLPEVFSAAGYETCLVGTLGVAGNRQFAGFDHRPYGDHTGTGGAQLDPLSTPLSHGSPYESRVSPTGGEYGHRYDPMDPDLRQPDPWQSLTEDAGPTAIPESRQQPRIVSRETISFLRDQAGRAPDQSWFACASFSAPHFPLTAPRRHFERYWPDGVTPPAVGADDAALDHPLLAAKAERDRESLLAGAPEAELDEEAMRRSRAAYFARVEYLDQVVGDLLSTLERDGLLEDTIVVYASAQGQLAGEYGLWWTGTWHEAATRVPLAVQLPEHRRSEIDPVDVSTPVSLLDLFPTLCELAGLDTPNVDGADLSPTVREGDDPDRGPVICDFFDPVYGEGTEFRMVRDEQGKYVRCADAPDRTFDLASDPVEDASRDVDAVEHLRQRAVESLDFESALQQRDADRERRSETELAIPTGTSGNAYLLDDRRLLDADDTLYKPDVLAQDASVVFADWPSSNGE